METETKHTSIKIVEMEFNKLGYYFQYLAPIDGLCAKLRIYNSSRRKSKGLLFTVNQSKEIIEYLKELQSIRK
jgi:hypothetical protein